MGANDLSKTTNSNGNRCGSRQTEASDELLTPVLGALRAVIEVDIELM